jgi:hypothetical protein
MDIPTFSDKTHFKDSSSDYKGQFLVINSQITYLSFWSSNFGKYVCWAMEYSVPYRLYCNRLFLKIFQIRQARRYSVPCYIKEETQNLHELQQWKYVEQSIISWIGRIMALLCNTADTRSHEMVPCPFFSHPSKKQLHVCGAFRKKVTAVKGNCLQAAEIENVTVWAMAKHQVLLKIRQIS